MIVVYGIWAPRWDVQSFINCFVLLKRNSVTTIGIDLAKRVFAVHSVDITRRPPLIGLSTERIKLL